MSRTVFGLVLGGALLLITAACGQGPTTEIIPADAENLEASSPDTGNADAQSPGSKERPIVTVSRNPT